MRSVAILLALALAACGRSDERVIFLRSGSADLPILVRGPPASDTLVLFVHGGPGGSGLVYAAAMPAAFDPISAEVLLAFYDQRGAGASQGNVRAEELTLDQHVADLGEVLALLRQEYPSVASVVLLGHSWGGTLTAAYLAKAERAAGVAGWINVAGATSFPRMLALSRGWAVDRASARVEAGTDPVRWREVLGWYEAHPVLDEDNLLTHLRHVDALGGTTFDPARAEAKQLKAAFLSPYSVAAELRNTGYTQTAMADELLGIDLHPALAAVTLPAIFLFGAEDGRVPFALGEEALAALGTAEGNKQLVRFERSGHRPFHEEPELFARTVLEFVNRLR